VVGSSGTSFGPGHVSLSCLPSRLRRIRHGLKSRPGRPRGQGLPGRAWAKVPHRGKNKSEPQKEANRAHAKLRALGERANGQLKAWKILSKLRCCPWRAGETRQSDPCIAAPRGIISLESAHCTENSCLFTGMKSEPRRDSRSVVNDPTL
jgi:hypothetical protein